MPKKAHGRPPGKAKNRPRRPATASPAPSRTSGITPPSDVAVAEPAPSGVTSAVPATTSNAPASASPARSARPVAPRRAAGRTTVTAVNYHYLRRDITSLSILAPAMVVLLVIAFFVLH